MRTELDEVYLANIKEIFKEFDDEIIWGAIFEKGYGLNGEFCLEKVIDYLLELSENKKYEFVKIPDSNLNQNNSELLQDVDEDEAIEIDNSGFLSNIFNSINGESGYQKLNNQD